MATVVDNTYFQRAPLYIPNGISINVAAPGDPEDNQISTDRLIELYEPEILIRALGIQDYTDLISVLGTLGDPGNEKWNDLVNGHTYTLDGVKYRWEGLRGRAKNSVIAQYIYCKYLELNDEVLTVMGASRPKTKAAESRTATDKYVRAWQTFLRMYQEIDTGAPVVSFNAFGTIGVDYSKGRNKTRSLLQYLSDLETVDPSRFPDVVFGVFTLDESQNSFGV